MSALYLYDIDGTILNAGGAGRRALNAAFHDEFGVADAFAQVTFAGRTDLGILREAFERAGLPSANERLLEAYLPKLKAELSRRTPTVLAGVPAAIDATGQQGHNALLTGNLRQGAQAKLRAVGLWERFGMGAYGTDAEDRNDLVPVARARAAAAGLVFDRVVVIGDTPADVACARAGGALAVGVCTGWSSRDALAEAQPDALLDDLKQGLGALLAL